METVIYKHSTHEVIKLTKEKVNKIILGEDELMMSYEQWLERGGRNLDNMKDFNKDKHVTISLALLDDIIYYIEKTEVTIDGEWGHCREVPQLIKDNEMPDLYTKLLLLKK